MLLKDLTTLTASLASGTLFHVEKSGKAYNIDYTKLAKAIVEEYNGSTLGGSAQSVQAAIADLNSRIPWLRAGMPEKRISGNATTDIITTASTKALVIVLSANTALSALFIVSTLSSGATSIAEIYKGTSLDIATDSFKVSITNSLSTNAYAYAFIFDGSGMS